MLWEVDIYPAEGQPDRAARSVAADAADLGHGGRIFPSRPPSGYLIQGDLSRDDVDRLARRACSPTRSSSGRSLAAVGDAVVGRPARRDARTARSTCCPSRA